MPDPPHDVIAEAVEAAGTAAAFADALGYDRAKRERLYRVLRGEVKRVGHDLVSDARDYLNPAPRRSPSLPGGGPARLGYLEEGTEASEPDAVPADVWFVFDLPGGGALHVPVSALADARRVGPAPRATGRVVVAPRSAEPGPLADQPQPA